MIRQIGLHPIWRIVKGLNRSNWVNPQVLPKYLFFGTNRYERTNDKLLASLLSPTAFAFGAEVLGDYE